MSPTNEAHEKTPLVDRYNSLIGSANLGNLFIKGHFSLQAPSSAVTFSDSQIHVFSDGPQQTILEKDGLTNVVHVKQNDVSTPGLTLIRAAYTIIAVLVTGFTFIFCIQMILFLFLGLVVEASHYGSSDFSLSKFLAPLLCLPALAIGMANAMAIAVSFIVDTWKGHTFMRSIWRWDSVLVDWIVVTIYIIVPFLTAALKLASGSADWWEDTLIAWFVGVFGSYIAFAIATITIEIDGCLQLVRFHPKLRSSNFRDFNVETNFEVVKRAILMKFRALFAGEIIIGYNSLGSEEGPTILTHEDDVKEKDGYFESKKWGAYLTGCLVGCGMFKRLPVPRRKYSVDEVCERAPFVTRHSWGLEKVFCRDRTSRFIAMVGGESAMTISQVRSSFICFALGVSICLCILVAFLLWFKLGTIAIIIVICLYVLSIFKTIKTSVGLRLVYQKLHDSKEKQDEEVDEVDAIYQVRETYVINEPWDWFCWTALCFEVVAFFIIPTYALFRDKNYPVAIIFIITAVVTAARRYLNAIVALEQLGSLEGLEMDNEDRELNWRERYRLGKVVDDISSSNKNTFWLWVFSFFILAFLLIFVTAIVVGSGAGDVGGTKVTHDFSYEGTGDLQYSSCRLGQGITNPAGNTNSLVDFSYISGVAYNDPKYTKTDLDNWFGSEAGVIDHQDIVEDFTTRYKKTHPTSAVTYKLLGFPETDVGVVAIRGTNNALDALSDAQLWSSAALAQWIRAIVPLGGWYTPILHRLVDVVSWVESSGLEEVSYYKETTAFVNYMKEVGEYKNLIIMGHSLGGGLAMITGAQTAVPSIGVSGPNAVISRDTFAPAVTEKALRKYTFNIVPDRDPVPRIDDLSQNFQLIKCTAPANNPFDCHSIRRSICEILYTCGSHGRPILCECVNKFGYPEPTSLNGSVFGDACPRE